MIRHVSTLYKRKIFKVQFYYVSKQLEMYRFIYFYVQSPVSASLFNTSEMLTYVAGIYAFMGI